MRGENRGTRRKTSWSKGENQQQIQPTFGLDAGIWKNPRNVFLSSRATCKDEEIKPSNTRLHLPPNTFGLGRFRCTIKDVNNCIECNDTAIFTVNVLQKKGNTCLNTADIANNTHSRWICISHYFRMLWAKIILQSKYSISLELQ